MKKIEKIIKLQSPNGDILAFQKTTIYEDGTIEHKFENPKTGHWVNYSTWEKSTKLSDKEKHLVKTFYVHSAYECVYEKYNSFVAIIFDSSNNVLLSLYDKLEEVLYKGDYYSIYLVNRVGRLTIEVDGYIPSADDLKQNLRAALEKNK